MRLTSLISVFLIVFYFSQLNDVYAATNESKPTIESISVDKKEATTGETVKISVKIKEYQEYGYLNIYYNSPLTGKGITICLFYNSETQTFEGNFPITDYIESGDYKPFMLSLYNNGITTIYSWEYAGFQNGGFIVNGTSGNDLIESISVDKKEVIAGDTVKISLKTRSHEGIHYMNAYFISPITNQRLTVSLYYNSETNTFEGNIPISSILESGTYKLDMLNTYETGNNTTAFYSSNYADRFVNGDFTVSGTNVSKIIESIAVNKQEVTGGEMLKFTVKSPKLVGINYLNLYYSSPITNKSFSMNLYYNNETEIFEGSYLLPNNFEVGVYTLFMVGLYDYSGNTTALYSSNYPEFENGNFSFYNTPDPPIVNEINENSTNVSGHAEANMQVYVKVGSTIIGKGRTDTSGNFTVEIPKQSVGTNVRLVVRDSDSHYSPYTTVTVTSVAPLAPNVNDVADVDPVVTGKAKQNCDVFIKVGATTIGRGKSDPSGEFRIPILNQEAGTKVRVVVRDGAGNYSPYTTVIVSDTTAPLAPVVNNVSAADTVVIGKAEPVSDVFVKVGSTNIGRGKADISGSFSIAIPKQAESTNICVVVRDGAGYYSPYTIVTVIK